MALNRAGTRQTVQGDISGDIASGSKKQWERETRYGARPPAANDNGATDTSGVDNLIPEPIIYFTPDPVLPLPVDLSQRAQPQPPTNPETIFLDEESLEIPKPPLTIPEANTERGRTFASAGGIQPAQQTFKNEIAAQGVDEKAVWRAADFLTDYINQGGNLRYAVLAAAQHPTVRLLEEEHALATEALVTLSEQNPEDMAAQTAAINHVSWHLKSIENMEGLLLEADKIAHKSETSPEYI